MISLNVLVTGMNNISKKISGTPNAEGIKFVIVTLYTCVLGLLGLWCLYKYKFKLPVLETFYSNKKDNNNIDPDFVDIGKKYDLKVPDKNDQKYMETTIGNVTPTFNEYKFNKDLLTYNKLVLIRGAIDKRYDLTVHNDCDIHEKMSKNGIFAILFGSDNINNEIIKDDIAKKQMDMKKFPGKNKSAFDKWSAKIFTSMGTMGEKIFQKGQNYMNNFANAKQASIDNAKTSGQKFSDLTSYLTEKMDKYIPDKSTRQSLISETMANAKLPRPNSLVNTFQKAGNFVTKSNKIPQNTKNMVMDEISKFGQQYHQIRSGVNNILSSLSSNNNQPTP